PYRPLFANFIVIRRCNLSCAYCTEYDHESAPVPLDVLRRRVDEMARLRVVVVSLTGGEPLMHPDLGAIVRHVRARGMTAAVSTNGFLVTRRRIEELNDAGTWALQLSLDGVRPTATTRKVLDLLAPKMELLARHARFRVRVNTIFGAAPPEESLAAVRAAMAYGFEAKCSLLRHTDGTVTSFDARAQEVYREIQRLQGRQSSLFDETFQRPLVRDGQAPWKCRAGARYFHVTEHGTVDLCAKHVGNPGKRLEDYGEDDLRAAFEAPKPCASRCAQAYARQLARIDAWRPQRGAPLAGEAVGGGRRLPVVDG
ncbi:MAG TPA: radical SAM protein, partial [Polyangiaceae bacterium]|nr:radical SAM protein [Polyangiaceae bacterium]